MDKPRAPGFADLNIALFNCRCRADSYDIGSGGMASISIKTPVRLIHPSPTAPRLAEGTVAVDEAWISHVRRVSPI